MTTDAKLNGDDIATQEAVADARAAIASVKGEQ